MDAALSVSPLSGHGVALALHGAVWRRRSRSTGIASAPRWVDMARHLPEGYVWRGAVPSDHVCVTGETRAQTAEDNSLAASRRAG